MLLPLNFVCPHCAQPNESAFDPSQGENQRFIEDCQVCCRPLILHARAEGAGAVADAFPESE